MERYCIAFFMLLVCPMHILGQDSLEISKLNKEVGELVSSNKQLRSELDSLKKMSLEPPRGFYVRLESSIPMKKSFKHLVSPISTGDLYGYSVGSFKNPKEAAILSSVIRGFNLTDYKVIYHGDFDPADSTFFRRRPTMWIED